MAMTEAGIAKESPRFRPEDTPTSATPKTTVVVRHR